MQLPCVRAGALQDIAIVQPQSVGGGGGGARGCEPRHCVLLRAAGAITVLDLDRGASGP